MPITRKIYRKGEQPAPLTVEQLAEINALKDLADEDIDKKMEQKNLDKIKNPPLAIKPKY